VIQHIESLSLGTGSWKERVFSVSGWGETSYDMYCSSRVFGGALCSSSLTVLEGARCPAGTCRSVYEQASPFEEEAECIYEELVDCM